jgi:GNAT superfamily N-acetyltransferase
MPNAEQLYYIHVPRRRRPVDLPVEFLTVTDFLRDEAACRAVWDLLHSEFHTRSKFLAIWPSVRHIALHRRDSEVVGALLVSTPLNWQIDYVMVRPDMRHQGISMALVNETTNQALSANAPYVMLTSRPELRPLYEGRCGFRVVAQSDSASPPVTLAEISLGNGHSISFAG